MSPFGTRRCAAAGLELNSSRSSTNPSTSCHQDGLPEWRPCCAGNTRTGNIAPAQFCAPAEESGDLSEIGRWVLNTACAEAMSWRRQELFDGRLAVNISIRQPECSEFVQTVKDALAGSGLPAGCLQLKSPRASCSGPPANSPKVLSALHALGVSLAVDDFGSGYSSLYHLEESSRLHTEDRYRLRPESARPENDKAIVRAILALGENLDLSIVAEGIETRIKGRC